MRLGFSTPISEFDENRHVQPVLTLAEIRLPKSNWAATCAGRKAAVEADQRARRAECVACRRCHASGAGEIGHVSRPMVVFPSESNVLAGHPNQKSPIHPRPYRYRRDSR